MGLRNCAKCGRMFNYVAGPPICDLCRKAMEEKFQQVKEFVRENPGAGFREISEACDVKPTQIREWVREERLMFAENSPIQMQCESCGAKIQTGRFCAKCKSTMATNLSNSIAKPKPVIQPPKKEDPKNRMRFMQN